MKHPRPVVATTGRGCEGIGIGAETSAARLAQGVAGLRENEV